MASPRIGLFMAMANVAAFLPEVRGKMAPVFLLGASPPKPVLPPLLLGGVLPPRLQHRRLPRVRARVGSQHWADSGACPARSRTCARCGKHGHFAKVCRSSGDPPAASSSGPSTVTNAVGVRQQDAIPIPAASPSATGGDGLQVPVDARLWCRAKVILFLALSTCPGHRAP
ncbi:hypothetical protein HPB50_009814 [Hyalomma asiaticum]|uniref:Uncharacterized protein n=1 Tax=Hyalomma asiaticum TaxID=266040 RepID=A0ACB7T6H2_HYAAI|nr:hypothetical protein HPB50_009814 [Hyalomma asiaticum]